MSSVLALVDYQPTMIKSIASGDKTIIKKATVIAAKPRVFWMYWFFLSSINPKSNGDVFPEIRELFPEQEKFQVLMLLKIKELIMLLKKQIRTN
jgi:nicotinamidase-related amidase